MESAVISIQGRPSYMEDTYFLDMRYFSGKDCIFGGVYDGHRGREAAEYLAVNLYQRFQEFLEKGLLPAEAFIFAYEKISEEIQDERVGACAANFLIKGKEIFFANAGDARIIIVSKDSVRQLTIDHRLSRCKERRRIERMGGEIDYPYVFRGDEGLEPTRAIGDKYFKPVGVIATPDVGGYEISDDDLFLIAASDGLFDEMNNRTVAKLTRKFNKPDELARALVSEVERRGGKDNITIIVIALNKICIQEGA